MPPLTAHLRTIVKDNVAGAVRQLQARATTGGTHATEELARTKAQAVISTLHAAVDNVRQQFVVGLRSAVPTTVAAALGQDTLDALCDHAVTYRCDRLRAIADLDEVGHRIWEEVAIVQDFLAGVSKAGPQSWLLSLFLGETKVALPEELEGYIATRIADHLDPYIDGEVTCPADETKRDTSPLYEKLLQAYERDHGRELPAPAELVLALYLRHGICKSNAYQCFTDLVMGQGRLPIMGDPQLRHCKALGVAIEKAVEKDFGKQLTKIQGVPISAPLVEELAKTHSDRLFFDHQKNGERLAEANRVGEIGRKEEMKRIFGIEI